MKKIFLNFLGLIALTLTSNGIAGGFHYEIDVMTHLFSDRTNKLESVEMSWLYSEEMTNMLLKDEDMSPAKKKKTLDTVGNRIISDLKGLHYFTKLQMNNKPVKTKNAENFSIELIDDKYLRLLFTLPLVQPVSIKKTTTAISLADPNGAGMLFYDTAERITMDQGLQAGCTISLVNFDEVKHGEAAQRVDIGCL